MNRERTPMFTRQLFGWAFTIVLLTSSLRAQEAVIGSRDSFAGQPTPATHVLTGHKYAVHSVAIAPLNPLLGVLPNERSEPRQHLALGAADSRLNRLAVKEQPFDLDDAKADMHEAMASGYPMTRNVSVSTLVNVRRFSMCSGA